MRQAIITKYLGPTNNRGSRIKATCAAKSVTVGYKSELSSSENHRQAAQKLADSLNWGNYSLGGSLPDGRYCFIQNTAATLADACLEWASESRNHGGNPYCYKFVKLAEEVKGNES